MLLQLYSFVVILQNQAHLNQEALGQFGDSNPPLFDPLGEGVDKSQLPLSGKVITHCTCIYRNICTIHVCDLIFEKAKKIILIKRSLVIPPFCT